MFGAVLWPQAGFRLPVLGVLLSLVFLRVPSVAAQDGGALVRPEPLVLEIGQGQVETLQLLLENAHEVYAIDVQARFDPAVVEVVDADPAQDGIQMTPGQFMQPDFLVRNVADNEAGTIHYVTTQVNPTLPASGTGVVLVVQFRGKREGEQVPLEIHFVDLADREGVKLEVAAQSGVLHVVRPKPETPTPVPAATAVPTGVTEPAPATVVAATARPAHPTGGAEPGVESLIPAPVLAGRNLLLVLIACGGCLATVMVLGLALLILLWRRRPGKP